MNTRCSNCCEIMVPGFYHGRLLNLHRDTMLPNCTFRDREHQVNSQRKVADLMKAEQRLFGKKAVRR